MHEATILVIEDNRDILDAIRLLLEREGFAVVTAENCPTALNYLAQYSPDLILTDLMIPELTGLEFIHHIRRICNYDRVPIIAMSAYDQMYLEAAIKAGAVTALHKPEDIDILVKTIKAVLAKNYRGEAAQAD
jgi:DNA-binding response OmpR family regulator